MLVPDFDIRLLSEVHRSRGARLVACPCSLRRATLQARRVASVPGCPPRMWPHGPGENAGQS